MFASRLTPALRALPRQASALRVARRGYAEAATDGKLQLSLVLPHQVRRYARKKAVCLLMHESIFCLRRRFWSVFCWSRWCVAVPGPPFHLDPSLRSRKNYSIRFQTLYPINPSIRPLQKLQLFKFAISAYIYTYFCPPTNSPSTLLPVSFKSTFPPLLVTWVSSPTTFLPSRLSGLV